MASESGSSLKTRLLPIGNSRTCQAAKKRGARRSRYSSRPESDGNFLKSFLQRLLIYCPCLPSRLSPAFVSGSASGSTELAEVLALPFALPGLPAIGPTVCLGGLRKLAGLTSNMEGEFVPPSGTNEPGGRNPDRRDHASRLVGSRPGEGIHHGFRKKGRNRPAVG
jgi:hypothetical protein